MQKIPHISTIVETSPLINESFKTKASNKCVKLLNSVPSSKTPNCLECEIKIEWNEVNNIYNAFCQGYEVDELKNSKSLKNLAENSSPNCNKFKIVKQKDRIAQPRIRIN